jgi:hypothetical protein
MARKKSSRMKKRITHHKRKHSMGAVEGGVMGFVGVIAGAVAAQFLGKAIDKALPATMEDKTKKLIDGAAPIALGLFMPKIIKSNLGKNLGTGMIAAGGLKLVQSQVPKLAGMAGMDYYANKPVAKIAGYQTGSGNYMAGFQTPQGNYIAGFAAAESMEKC